MEQSQTINRVELQGHIGSVRKLAYGKFTVICTKYCEHQLYRKTKKHSCIIEKIAKSDTNSSNGDTIKALLDWWCLDRYDSGNPENQEIYEFKVIQAVMEDDKILIYTGSDDRITVKDFLQRIRLRLLYYNEN